MTVKEFMESPGRSFGQFYGSYKRTTGKSVKGMADEFLESLEEDIACELEARGFDIDRKSIKAECESIRPNIKRLVQAFEVDKGNLDDSLKEVFTKKIGFEWYIQSENKLLSTRACEIFKDCGKLSLEFND